MAAFSVAGATGRVDTRRQGAHLRRVSAAATRALTGARLGTAASRDLAASRPAGRRAPRGRDVPDGELAG